MRKDKSLEDRTHAAELVLTVFEKATYLRPSPTQMFRIGHQSSDLHTPSAHAITECWGCGRDTIGPKMGPTNKAAENIGIENPRSLWFQKSAKEPPMTLTGEEPIKPCRNRHTRTVSRFCATATGIWKIAKMVKPTTRGSLRPYSSDNGPQIVGPVPKPRTKSETPRTITSGLVLNSMLVGTAAALKIEEANVTQRVGVACERPL